MFLFVVVWTVLTVIAMFELGPSWLQLVSLIAAIVMWPIAYLLAWLDRDSIRGLRY